MNRNRLTIKNYPKRVDVDRLEQSSLESCKFANLQSCTLFSPANAQARYGSETLDVMATTRADVNAATPISHPRIAHEMMSAVVTVPVNVDSFVASFTTYLLTT